MPEKRVYEKRRSLGLCVSCSHVVDRDTGVLCATCSNKRRDKESKRRVEGRCPKCGHPSTGLYYCDPCNRKYRDRNAIWRRENAEDRRRKGKEYRAKNPDKTRVWAKTSNDRRREAKNKWSKEHPETCRRQWLMRRARKANAKGVFTKEQVRDRMNLWGGRCAYCGGEGKEVDHVIPLSRGGTNWPANFRPCCRKCNATKGASLDWILVEKGLFL